jgi:hypothetical protein
VTKEQLGARAGKLRRLRELESLCAAQFISSAELAAGLHPSAFIL